MNRSLSIAVASCAVVMFIGVGAYTAWYSYHRHMIIMQIEKCEYDLAHPELQPKVRAPDGSMVSVMTPCPLGVIPPTLLDLVRGRVLFEGVPERMKINPYSFTDVLLARYTLGSDDSVPCNQSATTTDCSKLPPPEAPQPQKPSVAPDTNKPDMELVSATSTPISFYGFSFELPAGWHVSIYNDAHLGNPHAVLKSEITSRTIAVDCPPIGKGLEAATRLTSEQRMVSSNDGTQYSIAFEKWTAPRNDPWFFVWVRMSESGDSSEGSSGTYCLAQGSVSPGVEEAMRTMYETWK